MKLVQLSSALELFPVDLLKLVDLIVLAGKGFHYPYTAEVFLQCG